MIAVIAPDKFKGSLSARDAAEAMERGLLSVFPDAHCRLCPMADGGEGTVEAFLARGAMAPRVALVSGPLGDDVDAVFAMHGETAVLEMASASGLSLIAPERRDPTRTTTFGTGQLITAALDAGARRLIVGIGGSATNDAGVGMLRALGVRFFDRDGKELDNDILAYERLAKIDRSNLDARLSNVVVDVAIDVDNHLYGPNGAARVYAAQKGASPEDVDLLDRILRHIADVTTETLGQDFSAFPGSGAAGGLGFALIAYLRAHVEPGAHLIARECGLDRLLDGAALCLTGEGSIDAQTLHGKTVDGVLTFARRRHVPTLAFGGMVDRKAADALKKLGATVVAIAPGADREDAMKHAAEYLERAVAEAMERYHALSTG